MFCSINISQNYHHTPFKGIIKKLNLNLPFAFGHCCKLQSASISLQVIEEFGSFNKYIWSFVNYKPIASQFRYPRQVPVKTPKADFISKDMVRRGFRSVGPTVIYTFMQVAGLTNDHLVGCFRFQECLAAAEAGEKDSAAKSKIEAKTPDDQPI